MGQCCTVLYSNCLGPSLTQEEDEGTFLLSISASFPSVLFCNFCFWTVERTKKGKR